MRNQTMKNNLTTMKMMREVNPLKRTRNLTVKPLVHNDNVTQPTLNLQEFRGLCYGICRKNWTGKSDRSITGVDDANIVPVTYLLNVRQEKVESLPDILKCFNNEALLVDEIDNKVALTAFIVTVVVGNYKNIRVFKDNGSSTDILFVAAFHQLGNPMAKLQPIQSPLVGFSDEKVQPLGAIDLPVTMGTSPQLVVKRGDQAVVGECNVATPNEKHPKEALVIDALEVSNEKGEKRAEPVEKLLAVDLAEVR
ncbi:hypothetical protein Vadar_006279 [Vaccinium darrowii]|uniref:Uncharacterized protein n=1 Tax=Vaccinium darrowii TaxID=229202 RepID=A0ACB7ZHJ1_9ERIC|nr:hypothetical protein Vadar_006279 [Vaccinium darrowii]